jgi:hypothetical protein
MANKIMTLAEAMAGAQPDPDTLKLTTEQRYLKVIQALVSDSGGECFITPHVFGDPDKLICEQDVLGNICLKTDVL